jgi:hypothetical protein
MIEGGKTASLGYISVAKDMDKYLQSKWGPPDRTIPMDAGPGEMWDRMTNVQRSLAPGEIAVFAREGHTGIITPDYADLYALSPTHTVHIWILKPKPSSR